MSRPLAAALLLALTLFAPLAQAGEARARARDEARRHALRRAAVREESLRHARRAHLERRAAIRLETRRRGEREARRVVGRGPLERD